jgi:hypothetical protein
LDLRRYDENEHHFSGGREENTRNVVMRLDVESWMQSAQERSGLRQSVEQTLGQLSRGHG